MTVIALDTNHSNCHSLPARWLMFNVVGLLGILIQLSALALLIGILGLDYLPATALAVEVTVLHNFIWHECWTWAERSGGGKVDRFGRLVRFHVTNGLISILGNLGMMWLLAGQLGMNFVAANMLAIAACSLINFFAADRLVFMSPCLRAKCASHNSAQGKNL